MAAKGAAADAEKSVRLILKARGKRDFPVDVRPRSVAATLQLEDDRAKLVDEKERLEREIKIYSPYGDFDPQLARKLLDKGGDIADRLPAKLPQMRLSKMQEKQRFSSSGRNEQRRLQSASGNIGTTRSTRYTRP